MPQDCPTYTVLLRGEENTVIHDDYAANRGCRYGETGPSYYFTRSVKWHNHFVLKIWDVIVSPGVKYCRLHSGVPIGLPVKV